VTDDPELKRMYRLGELTDRQRFRYGGGALVVGLLLMVVGVIFVHIYGRPAEDIPTVQPFEWMFTSVSTENHHWFKGIGYLVVFAASQLVLAGAALTWVLNQRMTWARAMFAAFLTWMELVVVFGIVPSEWLNFSQTDLDWSFQNAWFDIPPALVLGNEVTISFGAVKDAISGGYNVTMLVLAGIFAYKIQDVGKPPAKSAAAEKETVSPYGRPLVKRTSKDED
jgi:hypothetical protein